jgi:hypothetical protein
MINPFSEILLYMGKTCILLKGIDKLKPCMCQKDSFIQIKSSCILDLSICMYCYPTP